MQVMRNSKGEIIAWLETYISNDEQVTVNSTVGGYSTITKRNLTTGKVETQTIFGRLPMPPEK
jgi:hypothetical protein